MDSENWSEVEKRKFLVILLKHGASDLSKIQSLIPDKSIVQVRAMIDYYKRQAHLKLFNSESKKSDEVMKWIEIMQKISLKQNGSIQDVVPRALKYIALYEKKNDQSDIDLSEAYTFLSDISNGKSPKPLPERTAYFLYQCLVRLAENLQKQEIHPYESHLKNLESFEELLKYSEQSVINPLGIPDNLLQVSPLDFSGDETGQKS